VRGTRHVSSLAGSPEKDRTLVLQSLLKLVIMDYFQTGVRKRLRRDYLYHRISAFISRFYLFLDAV